MKSDTILEKIQNKLKESDPQKRTILKIFQFHFKDCEGNHLKSVVMDFKKLEIYEGIEDTNAVDVEVVLTDEDFYNVGMKKVSLKGLIEEGKVEVNGDMDALNQLIEKFKFHGGE